MLLIINFPGGKGTRGLTGGLAWTSKSCGKVHGRTVDDAAFFNECSFVRARAVIHFENIKHGNSAKNGGFERVEAETSAGRGTEVATCACVFGGLRAYGICF